MKTNNNIHGQHPRPILSTIMMTLIFACTAFGQATLYVDDDNCPAVGVGSLVDPYCAIQVAIDASANGDSIEVSPGTYFETIDLLGKAITLRSANGSATTTIDATGIPNASVVRCVSGETAATVLDGFTITGGTGDISLFGFPAGGGMLVDGSSPTVTNCNFVENIVPGGAGGGMYNSGGSSPTITNCIFIGNSTSIGGGMYNHTSSPTISNCSFNDNLAINRLGGGMRNYKSNPTITNCTFSRNSAVDGGGIANLESTTIISGSKFLENSASFLGGGMNDYDSNVTITDCEFSRNSAPLGGGMNNDSSVLEISNCTFRGNTADFGGGMFASLSSVTVANCNFTTNFSSIIGGGMCNEYCSPTVIDSRFYWNTSSSGGGMFNHEASPTVINCTFNSNMANSRGGGIYNQVSGKPTITNCTFYLNSGRFGGGGIYNDRVGPIVTNCILWNNSPNELANNNSVPTIAYSLIEGSGGSTAWNSRLGTNGGGNIDADPLFVDPLGDDDDLRLMPGSPAIDAGDNTALPNSVNADLDGNQRFANDPATADTGNGTPPIVDMGAYEFQPTCGNGMTDPDEECDDGNTDSGDGCDENCHIELGACCLETACSYVTQIDCEGDGGSFLGLDINCPGNQSISINPCAMPIIIDIKPGSCPNPINRKSKGMFPIAIIGSLGFDVSEIDVDSLSLARSDGIGHAAKPLNGKKGPGIVIEDVATAIEAEPCSCHELGGDGTDDLLLKFSTPELANALVLDSLARGATIELMLQGSLLDGTSFVGSDCILVQGKTRNLTIIRPTKRTR